jgi:hypothetical protein
MREGEQVSTARLSVSMYLDCPHCAECFDLFDMPWINEEGQLWSVLRSNNWEGLGIQLECPQCSQAVIFDKLEY